MQRTLFSNAPSSPARSAAASVATNNTTGLRTGSSLPHGEQDASEMEISMICTCVVELGPKICFATYDENDNTIIIEEISCSGKDFAAITERYFSLIRPNLLLVGSSIVSNEGFLDTLVKPVSPGIDVDMPRQQADGTEQAAMPNRADSKSIPYRVLKTSAFDSRNCMSTIMQKLRVLSLLKNPRQSPRNLAMADISRTFDPTAHRSFPISSYHMLGSLIDFESQLQIKAVGALLSFLQSTIFKLESNGTVTVANVVHSQSSKFMSVNASTVAALQIFSTEHHPLMASKGRGNSKEGSSLFSLLDRTQNRGGRELLKHWMLKPLLDKEEIVQRQDSVELFLSPMLDSEASVGALIGSLKEIGPITQILARMTKCTTKPMDFVILLRTLSAAYEICDIITTDLLEPLRAQAAMQQRATAMVTQPGMANAAGWHGQKALRYINFLERILRECNIQALSKLEEQIRDIVDEDSTYEARDMVCIRTGFSPPLDGLKEEYSCLNEHLNAVCQQIKQTHPSLRDLAVVFMPQVGFLIAIKTRLVFLSTTGQLRLRLPEDFTHAFNNDDGNSYFKNATMRDLDNNVGDLDGKIKDMESMIVAELEDEIMDHENELRATYMALSELDCILSFAVTAKDRDYVRPTILSRQDESNTIIRIKQGRHPLQEILVEGNFVCNDVSIDGANQVNVVTGPNFSGKSTLARQIGSLVYMAQLGSFLPCEAAQISVVDQILAQFSKVESCAVPQSSFQLDLTQMGSILRKATSKSLVLIDEFGKGTNPASGIALLTAALKKFSSVGATVVCTTHFLEVFSRKLLVDGQNGVKTLRMAVHVPRDDAEIAAPLFRLEEGVADSSAGIICARMAGLKPAIVDRAKEIVLALKQGKALKPNPSLMLSSAAKEVLQKFLSHPSWEDATEAEVQDMLQRISML